MVFSSIQAYLDSYNWQQTTPSSYHHATGVVAASGVGGGGGHVLSPRPPPPPPQHGNGVGSTRPGSMADRARMANIPMPEAALKCPRCESTNTKFCYFNNYSLTQPRHFCKNCRRYWTRGGALRNVPVGGGCRRNRRSKSSNSNNNNNNNLNAGNAATAATAATASSSSGVQSSTIGAMISSSYGNHESILSQILSPARLMSPSFNHLNDNIGLLNYGVVSGGSSQDLSSIHMGSAVAGGGGGSLLSCIEQWRPSQPQTLQPLPALGGGGGNLEDTSNTSSGFYSFHESGYVRPMKTPSSISSVKVEDNPYKWGGNGTFSPWMDLSSFGSSG